MTSRVWAAAAAVICLSSAVRAQSADFDYYVLSLSWSPGFCDLGGKDKSSEQCAVGSGQGFVVHGLWPNKSEGANPEDCSSFVSVSKAALQETHGVYPAEGLAAYEYRKHGACTGLDALAYFKTVKSIASQIVIPEFLKGPHEKAVMSADKIQRAFIDANDNLQPANFAVTCRAGELEDVRICVTPDLKGFFNCPKVAGHTCHSNAVTIAPVH